MEFKDLSKWKLRNAPRPLKAMAAGYLFALSLAYIYAIGNIAMSVGLTPKSIAIHYYGNDGRVVDEPGTKNTTGEVELNLDAAILAEDIAKNPGPRPSFRKLVAEGHFHLFGMSSFFFGMTLLGFFTGLSDKWKTFALSAPYVTVVLDNLSFLATRFGGPEFAYLTVIAGTLMGISFMILWFAIGWELKQPAERV